MATNPIEARMRYDKDATRGVLAYKEGIAEEALSISPIITQPKSGQYPSYGPGEWQYTNFDSRAPSDPKVMQITFPALSWTDYFIPEVPRKKFIDRQDQARSGTVAGLAETDVKRTAERVKHALQQALSYKIITDALAGVGGTATPTNKWNQTGATPVDDLQNYIDNFEAQLGIPPNGIVFPRKVFRHVGAGIRAEYGITGETKANVALVKEILMLDLGIPAERMYISKATLYSGSTFANMYSDAVLLFYSATNPKMIDWEPSYMASITPDDVPWFRVLPPYSFGDPGQWVECIAEILPKVLMANAGYSITATLA